MTENLVIKKSLFSVLVVINILIIGKYVWNKVKSLKRTLTFDIFCFIFIYSYKINYLLNLQKVYNKKRLSCLYDFIEIIVVKMSKKSFMF